MTIKRKITLIKFKKKPLNLGPKIDKRTFCISQFLSVLNRCELEKLTIYDARSVISEFIQVG